MILAESQNFARVLINEPGNVLTPTESGRRAAAMAKKYGLKCDVHSTDKLNEFKMGAFSASRRAPTSRPRSSCCVTNQPTRRRMRPVLGLVGKGITFDTGGISIKPADSMEKMKYDMAGGAAMIGAMRAIAQLKPTSRHRRHLLRGEHAGRQSLQARRFFTAMSGKTIEIINTDAEGRLVLADGLTYAQTARRHAPHQRRHPHRRCRGGAGPDQCGLFTNSDDDLRHFAKATEQSGERFWRLPIEDEYREPIARRSATSRTPVAATAEPITAAMFLKEFVGRHTVAAPGHRRQRMEGRTRSHGSPKARPALPCARITEWVRTYA